MSQRYYDILGVNKDASIMEMKEAYERLCKEYEPSDHQFDPEYVKRYEEVQEAFDWLKNNHMWTINVEEENNDETAPPQQPDKQEKLIDLRYVLLAVVILSSAICYLFVSPYLGSGSSQNVVVSNHESKEFAQHKINEEALEDLYDFTIEGAFANKEEFIEFAKNTPKEDMHLLFKDGVFADNEEFSKMVSVEEPKGEQIYITANRSEATESELREYYGDADFQDKLSQGLFERKPQEEQLTQEIYRYDGAFYSRQDLVDKYGEKVEEAINKFGIQVVDKKSGITTPIQSPNTTTSLSHGGNPYGYCYTSSKSCSSRCSEIKVNASNRTGVIVIIKGFDPDSYLDNGVGTNVVSCAYIEKGRSFTFKLPNGTYTPYFYSGTGWSNKKYMKTTTQCGRLYGGFTAGESVGKDTPQTLNNQILSYDLNTQYDGNFQTKSSDVSEAF